MDFGGLSDPLSVLPAPFFFLHKQTLSGKTQPLGRMKDLV